MSSVAAIVLAAGRSRRFGEANKLLAELEGEPMVRRVIRTVLASGAAPVLLVTGHEAAAVSAALTGLAVHIVQNPRYHEGMGTSVAAGFDALSSLAVDARGALVVLADMPDVDEGLLGRLIEAFLADGGTRITFPVDRDGRQRNPVLWPRQFWPALTHLTGDTGGRDLIAAARERCHGVAIESDAIGLDIDTTEALAAWRAGRPHRDK
jgi:molybdenum cofactor cytidylyltransferase